MSAYSDDFDYDLFEKFGLDKDQANKVLIKFSDPEDELLMMKVLRYINKVKNQCNPVTTTLEPK